MKLPSKEKSTKMTYVKLCNLKAYSACRRVFCENNLMNLINSGGEIMASIRKGAQKRLNAKENIAKLK